MLVIPSRCLALIVVVCLPMLVQAADHRVEALSEKAPDGLAAPIAAQLNDSGVKVIRGTSRSVCEIWLTKQWALKSLEAQGDVNYPFIPGQLVGVIHYPRKGADFRDQEIDPGLYTLRYAQQPVDGAHVGTSPTRDFLLLVRAADDKAADVLQYSTLAKASTEAAQTAHPALLSLQKPEGKAKTPAMRHEEEKDWWIVQLTGKAKAGDKAAPLTVELVVAGQASE